MKKRCVSDGRWFLAALVLMLGLAASPSPGAATHITCGAVLGPGGTFTLDSNVGPCPDPVVITVNAATLNLNGFTISGTAVLLTGQHCVELIGSGATLRGPGTVQTCERGVVVIGAGRHVVRDVVSQLNTNVGFSVFSRNNRVFSNTSTLNTFVGFSLGSQFNLLTNNTATHNSALGFQVTGASHLLVNNTATHNGDGFHVPTDLANRLALIHNTASNNSNDGFNIFGANHILSSNTATSNLAHGMTIQEQGNTVEDNTTSDNSLSGVSIVGSSNKIQANFAANNGTNGIEVLLGATGNRLMGNEGESNSTFDLADDNPNCDQNRWRRNTGTRNQPCIR
jgi:parallel beta-helix repeat protein